MVSHSASPLFFIWLMVFYEVRVTELEYSFLVAWKLFQTKGKLNSGLCVYVFSFKDCKLT